MLKTIKADSLEQLISETVPDNIRLKNVSSQKYLILN